MANLFQKALNFVAKHFRNDASKMLIITGVAGWTLSSLAQIVAIVTNPKIKKEQKGFLIPQEIYDAVTNITAYFLITLFTKRTVAKMFSTGKWASKNVRAYLDKNAKLLGEKVGKVDFCMDEVMEKAGKKLNNEYETTKSFGTTVATIGAGILATNIVTPIVRNKKASSIQKSYIEINKENQPSAPDSQQIFKLNSYNINSGSLKI